MMGRPALLAEVWVCGFYDGQACLVGRSVVRVSMMGRPALLRV